MMMKWEDHFCTVESAKKLFELGVIQLASGYWDEIKWLINCEDPDNQKVIETKFMLNAGYRHYEEDSIINRWAAFTSDDISQYLPDAIRIVKLNKNKWRAFSLTFAHGESATLADCMAKCLIHLIEQNIIPAPKDERKDWCEDPKCWSQKSEHYHLDTNTIKFTKPMESEK